MSKTSPNYRVLLPLLFVVGGGIATIFHNYPGLFSEAHSTTNILVEQSKAPNIYLITEPNTPEICYRSDRRKATMRRSDLKRGGTLGICRKIESSGPSKWFFASEKESFSLIPINEIADLTYPHAYRQVRKLHKWYLPKIGWVNLFVNRLYVGAYLKIDLSKLKGFEFWQIDGEKLYTFDNSIMNGGERFFEYLSDKKIKKISIPAEVKMLLSIRPSVMAISGSNELLELPLPYSLAQFNPELVAKKSEVLSSLLNDYSKIEMNHSLLTVKLKKYAEKIEKLLSTHLTRYPNISPKAPGTWGEK
ncbi:MAG: hypothetical protein KAG61_11280 [Bacteriovoracaceae bacterium]|nr:hypothetical protein [Bacteriovoracaceae bacterium]